MWRGLLHLVHLMELEVKITFLSHFKIEFVVLHFQLCFVPLTLNWTWVSCDTNIIELNQSIDEFLITYLANSLANILTLLW
jgi:hypothetical protein